MKIPAERKIVLEERQSKLLDLCPSLLYLKQKNKNNYFLSR